MTFQKGHKLATGRPKGSLNKLTKANREFLHSILFDEEQFIKDWMELDLNGRMELRTRLNPITYILPKPKDTEEIQKETQLFIDEPVAEDIYKNFGLDPELLKNPQDNNLILRMKTYERKK